MPDNRIFMLFHPIHLDSRIMTVCALLYRQWIRWARLFIFCG